ncbi:MAG TPA: IPT/TIG domain-containing protein [Thermoanaerobaculia bacterium]|nr:IPT/TIG domain-containing protein [Thermoanaerobaculia bacterium]
MLRSENTTIRLSLLALLICSAAFAQQPRIDGITPSNGPISGGTIVTVSGAGFTGSTVKLDGATITPLTQSDTQIELQMPQRDNGYAPIQIGDAVAEFLYVPPRLEDLPPGYVTTVAGIGSFTRDYGPANQAVLKSPWGLELDADGNLYLADTAAARVYKIRTDGIIERVAGSGVSETLTGDGGPAVKASLTFPRDTALDGRGNVYIGGDACRLRRVAPDGIITTIAGDGTCAFSGDGGPASSARIGQPTFLVADTDDLFFIDWSAKRVRRIHFADGTISTFAGNGTAGFSGDGGPATSASFNLPNNDLGSLALDPQGNLYLADESNSRIRRIDRQTGIITTFYMPPTGSQGQDAVQSVRSIAFDRDGNLYYGGSGRIVKVNPAGQFVTAWGNGKYAFPVDGAPAATSGLGHDIGLAIDRAGNIIYSDDAIRRVRRINVATGLLETVAGIGPSIVGENGPAIATDAGSGTEGADLAFGPDGELVIADAGNGRIRRLEANGNLTTIGGTGGAVGSISGGVPATGASMYPIGVEVDRAGNIDVAQRGPFLHIDTKGILTYIGTSNPACGYAGDNGPLADARFCQAYDLTRDADGNLFIADTNNNRVRRVDAKTNIVTVVAGNGGPVNGFENYGHGQYCGDGGPAVDSCINTPYGVVFDDDGNLFVTEGGRIRKIDRAGIISTFSGAPTLPSLTKLAFFRGYIYAASQGVTRFDRHGVRTRIAGLGSGPLGDGGPALSASLGTGGQAVGIAIDSQGNIFLEDVGHRRIRAIRYGALLPPSDARIQATTAGSSIRATVTDGQGRPAESVRLDFTAPAGGATCALSSLFAITDRDGVATVTCTPDCVAGSYNVTISPLASATSVSVPMANSGPCRRRAVRH